MNKNNSWINIIIKTIVVSGLIIIGLNVYDYINISNSDESYYNKKMTIEQIENSNPKKFLSVTGTYHKSFWETKLIINGEIRNQATVARYKDVKLRVNYYSKTKSVITKKDYMIYEIFPPNSTVDFKLKVENYKNVESIGWDLIYAAAN